VRLILVFFLGNHSPGLHQRLLVIPVDIFRGPKMIVNESYDRAADPRVLHQTVRDKPELYVEQNIVEVHKHQEYLAKR
jgi:hypothetical protein